MKYRQADSYMNPSDNGTLLMFLHTIMLNLGRVLQSNCLMPRTS